MTVPLNQRVLILGAGIAGCTAAWVLTKAGYQVSLLEQKSELFDGTSRGAKVIHLGERYPFSWQTAIECLHSAILLKKLMPFALTNETSNILLADKSAVNPIPHVPTISYADYLKFCEKLANYYASLPPSDKVFGHSDSLFTPLKGVNLDVFKHIIGGVASQAPFFNMEGMRSNLLENLEKGCSIQINSEVLKINKVRSHYQVTYKNTTNGAINKQSADILVNCTGYNAYSLNGHFDEPPELTLQLRLFTEVDLSPAVLTAYPFSFDLVPGIITYYLTSKAKATIFGMPTCIDKITTKNGFPPKIPDDWHQTMLASASLTKKYAAKVQKLIHDIRSNFMPLFSADIAHARVFPGISVAFDREVYKKTLLHPKINEAAPNFYILVPTKASHALSLSLSLLTLLLKKSGQNNLAPKIAARIFEAPQHH